MSETVPTRRVVVVGGGVSGLAAAHRLVERRNQADLPVEVIVLEAGAAPGGSITTLRRDGFLVEGGPDSFITQKPWALALCRRIGLIDSVIQTNEHHRRTFIVRRGRMHPMPEGFMMLAPTRMWPFAFSRLFTLGGKIRMGLDLLVPRGGGNGDESLASFVRRRLGREALERAAQPLVSGIYTADPERLSLRATMPRFLEMEQKYGSVIRAMRQAGKAERKARRGEGGARYSIFVSFAEGMDTLVNALVARLPAGSLRLNTPVRRLASLPATPVPDERSGRPPSRPPTPAPPGQPGARRWSVQTDAGRSIEADAVVLAAPAHALAGLTADLDPELSAMLGRIQYASSATVNFAFRRDQIGHALDGFGLVVPHVERRTIIASTFSHVKFPGRAPEGMALLRAFIGGALNPDVYARDDDAIRAAALAELTDLLHIRGEPLFTTLHRWPESMPQYAVGHLDQVAALNARLAELPPAALAGNAFGGVGIPDCVHSGEQAADAVLAALAEKVPVA